jgi:hypothetical protein
MKNSFNELVSYYLTENIGLGPMQFTGQNTYVFLKKQKSASKKKRSKKEKSKQY